MKRRIIALIIGFFLAASFCAAQDLSVAAAADLQFAFQDVAARFEKDTGHHVQLIFGSSGNFYTQIQNGAPFDLFFSADVDYPKKLEAAGLTEPGSLYEYATGKLVLWVPQQSPLVLTRGLPVLLDPRVKKIAIANPQHAPYGRAAVAALQHEKLYERITDKLVLGENISQTASFVVSGSADIGMVALSLALAPSMKDKGRYVNVPVDDYPAIVQGAVILKSSKQSALAHQFLSFLKSPAMIELMKTYGFVIPEGNPTTR